MQGLRKLSGYWASWSSLSLWSGAQGPGHIANLVIMVDFISRTGRNTVSEYSSVQCRTVIPFSQTFQIQLSYKFVKRTSREEEWYCKLCKKNKNYATIGFVGPKFVRSNACNNLIYIGVACALDQYGEI